jgi:hypothetical protein
MQNKEHALRELLRDVFDINELHQWSRLQLGKDIHDELPHGTSLTQAAFDVTMAIGRHGRADATLFEGLRTLRPRLAERILAVAGLWGITIGPDVPSRPALPEEARIQTKYHVYISQTKVEMLYPQIPSAPASASQDSLPQRLNAICDFVRQNEDVGTALEPGKYIFDTCALRYGIVWEYASDIAFLGGTIGSTTVGLIGSSTSLIGEAHRTQTHHSPYYYTLKFLNRLMATERRPDASPPYYTFAEATAIALHSLPPHHSTLEFLAKTLHKEENLVIATPIYVAMAR